jgi:hypothetical protein
MNAEGDISAIIETNLQAPATPTSDWLEIDYMISDKSLSFLPTIS